LKTVLDFAGISVQRKKIVAEALDDMAAFLTPVSKCVAHISGADKGHLVNGLATRTVGRKQIKYLKECQYDKEMRKTWLYRSGQANITLGATAAILVAHYVLAVTGSQPKEVIDNLTRSIGLTRNLLDVWNTSVFSSDKMYTDALGAEIRALERARASAIAAEKISSSQKLDRLAALHLQLRYMREAAWPAHAVCEDGCAHFNNLEQLRHGVPFSSSSAREDDLQESGEQNATILIGTDLEKAGYVNPADDLTSESGRTSSSSSASSSCYTQSSASTFESDDEEDEEDEDEEEEEEEEEEEAQSEIVRTRESLAACMNL
jgi:hypothetical protein